MNHHQRHMPRQVDAFKLAQQAAILDGSLAVSELPRLAAAVCDSSTILHPELSFSVDENGRRTVKGRLQASLSIACQRCLEAMHYDVVSELHFAFVTNDEQAKALPAHLEPVMLLPNSSYVDVYDMLEDELLLSLPITVFHDYCESQGSMSRSFGEIELDKSSVSEKPFSTLAKLFNKDH